MSAKKFSELAIQFFIIAAIGILTSSNMLAASAKALFYEPSLDLQILSQETKKHQRMSKENSAGNKNGYKNPIAKKNHPRTNHPTDKPAATIDSKLGRMRDKETIYSGVRYWFELQPRGNKYRYIVDPRSTFRSGDRVRIHFTSNQDGYLFILQKGSSGKTTLLFPSPPGQAKNFIKAGAELVTPEPRWFKFDNQPGHEQISVLFYPVLGEPAVLKKLTASRPNGKKVKVEVQRLIARYNGSRDLVIEIDDSYFTENTDSPGAPVSEKFSFSGKISGETLPPAAYVVNSSKGKFAQPVVFQIILNHDKG